MKIEKLKFEKIKAIALELIGFSSEEAKTKEEEDKTKFEEAKIQGGDTVISYNPSLEVGSVVNVSSGTGSVPATDGTITLDNGIVFVVKDGKIESVTDDGKEAETEEEKLKKQKEAESVQMSLVTPEMFKELSDKVDKLLNGNSENFTAQKDELGKLKTLVSNFSLAVQEGFEEIAKISVNVPEFVDPNAKEVQGVNFEAVAQSIIEAREAGEGE